MSWTGREEIKSQRSVLTMAAIRSVSVMAALLALGSSGWAESKPLRFNAPGPAQSRPSAVIPMQIKPVANSVRITTGALRMTGWDAATSQTVKVTTGALQMTGWDAATSQTVQVTTSQLQMTGWDAWTLQKVQITTGQLQMTGSAP